MRVKAEKVPALLVGLNALLGGKLKKDLAYRLVCFTEEVQAAAKRLEEMRRKYAKEYGSPSPEGGYVFKTGTAMEAFSADIEELMNTEIELPDMAIKLDDVPDDLPSIGQVLFQLKPIIGCACTEETTA